MVWFGSDQVDAIKGTTTPREGSDNTRVRILVATRGGSCGSLEAPDVAVAQAVVDEGDEFAGDRCLGDPAAVASFGKAFSFGVQPRVAAQLLGGFDCRPAHQFGALKAGANADPRGKRR